MFRGKSQSFVRGPGRKTQRAKILKRLALIQDSEDGVDELILPVDMTVGFVMGATIQDKLSEMRSRVLGYVPQEASEGVSGGTEAETDPEVQSYVETARAAAKAWLDDVYLEMDELGTEELKRLRTLNQQALRATQENLLHHMVISGVLRDRVEEIRRDAAEKTDVVRGPAALFMNRLLAAGVQRDDFRFMSKERLAAIVAVVKGKDAKTARELVEDVPFPCATETEKQGRPTVLSGETRDDIVTKNTADETKDNGMLVAQDDAIVVEVDDVAPADFVGADAAGLSALAPDDANGKTDFAATVLANGGVAAALEVVNSLVPRGTDERLNLPAEAFRITRHRAETPVDFEALTWPLPPMNAASYWDLVEGDPEREALAKKVPTDFASAFELFRRYGQPRGLQFNRAVLLTWLGILVYGQPGVTIDEEDLLLFHGVVSPLGEGLNEVIQVVCTLPSAKAEHMLFNMKRR